MNAASSTTYLIVLAPSLFNITVRPPRDECQQVYTKRSTRISIIIYGHCTQQQLARPGSLEHY
jgi:hypothetical protein